MNPLEIGWLVMGEPPQPNPPYVDQWGLMRAPEDLVPLPEPEDTGSAVPSHMGKEPLHQGPGSGPFTPHDVLPRPE